MTFRFMTRICIATCLGVNSLWAVQPEGGKLFASPQDAVKALIQAAKKNKTSALLSVLGPEGKDIIESGDPSDDKERRRDFVRLTDEHIDYLADSNNANKMEVALGKENWPFPIPLMRTAEGRWQFDAAQGRTEILARRIGANELSAVEICQAYVEAQIDYAEKHSHKGVPEYAQRIKSSAGKQDGLYWDSASSATVSAGVPKDFAIAAPMTPTDTPEPYHGYYFKILTGQGAAAKGGKVSYIANGSLMGGFGLVAWPAKYAVSGVQTFIVSHDGVVYEKHLGEDTDKIARAMTDYNPDSSWQPAATVPQ